MIRTLMIEGFPVCFGEGEKPSWYEGDKIDALGKFDSRPVITQVLNNTLGGVAETSDVTFELVDSERGAFDNNRSLANIFRFLGEHPVTVLGPNPTLSDETTLEMSRSTHGTKKALRVLDASPGYKTTNPNLILDSPTTYGIRIKGDSSFTSGDRAMFEIRGLTIPNRFILYVGSGILRMYAAGGGAATVAITNTGSTLSNSTEYWLFGGWDGTNNFLYDGNQYKSAARGLSVGYEFIEIFGSSIAANVGCGGDVYEFRVWDDGLTEAQMSALVTDGTDPGVDYIFRSDMAPWSDTVIWDKSGNQNHIGTPSSSSWETREYIKGDLLYLPNDTVRVQSVDTGTDELTVERQVFSCLEDGYNAYYAALPYNTIDGDLYVCLAQEDYPSQYPGRLVAYYEGGHTTAHLRYLGFMKTPNQLGKSWTFETTHILKPLREGFAPIQTNLALKTNGAGSAWWIGNPSFSATDTTGAISQQLTAEGLKTLPEIETLFQLFGNDDWVFGINNGFLVLQSTAPTVNRTPASAGLWDVCSDDDEFSPTGYSTYRSLTTPLDNYGFIYGHDAGEAYMSLELDTDSPWNLDGAWVTVESTSGEKYYLKIADANYSTGVLQVQGPYDEDLNYLPGQTFGVKSSAPVQLKTAQIADAPNLPRLIYRLLTSTGTATNGSHDALPGWMGLGLPSSLVDDSILSLSQNWPIVCNLSDADITEDLKFMGVALVWDGNLGKFALKKFRPPAIGLATGTIDNDSLGVNERINVAWGQVAPVSSFKFKTVNGELSATVQLPSMWPGAQLNEISMETQTGCRIESADLMIADVVERLRWLSNYAPVVTMTSPGHTYQIGDQVLLSVDNVAGQGQGRYTTQSIPSIVVGMGKGPNTDWLQIQLNTRDTTGIAAWVPSWEIESYSGTTCALRKGEALKIETVFTLPLTVQIIDSLGTVLDATRTIVSITDADTVELNAAPTYTAGDNVGIITLPDYTSATSTDAAKYVWAANTSGLMSNADTGKVLT